MVQMGVPTGSSLGRRTHRPASRSRMRSRQAAPEILTALDGQQRPCSASSSGSRSRPFFTWTPMAFFWRQRRSSKRSEGSAVASGKDDSPVRDNLAQGRHLVNPFAGINENDFCGQLDTRNDGVLRPWRCSTWISREPSWQGSVVQQRNVSGPFMKGRASMASVGPSRRLGCEMLVTSLWEVSDAGTQALLALCAPRSGYALPPGRRREAQRRIGGLRWGYPYVWAAFMMVSR